MLHFFHSVVALEPCRGQSWGWKNPSDSEDMCSSHCQPRAPAPRAFSHSVTVTHLPRPLTPLLSPPEGLHLPPSSPCNNPSRLPSFSGTFHALTPSVASPPSLLQGTCNHSWKGQWVLLKNECCEFHGGSWSGGYHRSVPTLTSCSMPHAFPSTLVSKCPPWGMWVSSCSRGCKGKVVLKHDSYEL